MTRNVMHSGESLPPRGLRDGRGRHADACTAGGFCI